MSPLAQQQAGCGMMDSLQDTSPVCQSRVCVFGVPAAAVPITCVRLQCACCCRTTLVPFHERRVRHYHQLYCNVNQVGWLCLFYLCVFTLYVLLVTQVRSLSEETARLRSQALEAAGQVEVEQVARRVAESALSQLRLQVEGSRSAESSALQQAGALASQVKELSAALEAVRVERNKLQVRLGVRYTSMTQDTTKVLAGLVEGGTNGREW